MFVSNSIIYFLYLFINHTIHLNFDESVNPQKHCEHTTDPLDSHNNYNKAPLFGNPVPPVRFTIRRLIIAGGSRPFRDDGPHFVAVCFCGVQNKTENVQLDKSDKTSLVVLKLHFFLIKLVNEGRDWKKLEVLCNINNYNYNANNILDYIFVVNSCNIFNCKTSD